MKQLIKKGDIILFCVLVALGLLFTGISLIGNSNGSRVAIYVEGKEYGTYPLSKDQTIIIDEYGHHNEIAIKDGKIQMMKSNCHNQICVMQGAVSTSNLPIVCLPNRVEVVILTGEEEYDVVAR